MQCLRKSGVRWLSVAIWAERHGHSGRKIADAPAHCGLRKVECLEDICLFRLADP